MLHGRWPGLAPSTRTAFGPRRRPSTAAESRPDRSTTTAPGRPPATWTRTVLSGGSTRPVNANAESAAAPIASSGPWPAAVPASGAPAAGRDRSIVPMTRPCSGPVQGIAAVAAPRRGDRRRSGGGEQHDGGRHRPHHRGRGLR